MRNLLPEKGHIGIIRITDKQFGSMEIFQGKKPQEKRTGWQQLELFLASSSSIFWQ